MSRPLPPGVPDILARIVVTKHEEVAAARARRSLSSLREEAESRTDLRDFEAALRTKIAAAQLAVIADIKKASPSKGVIRPDFRPA